MYIFSCEKLINTLEKKNKERIVLTYGHFKLWRSGIENVKVLAALILHFISSKKKKKTVVDQAWSRGACHCTRGNCLRRNRNTFQNKSSAHVVVLFSYWTVELLQTTVRWQRLMAAGMCLKDCMSSAGTLNSKLQPKFATTDGHVYWSYWRSLLANSNQTNWN